MNLLCVEKIYYHAHFSFPQACRGSQLDKGVKIIHETDSKRTTYSIPAYADIMVAYSTYDGTYIRVIYRYNGTYTEGSISEYSWLHQSLKQLFNGLEFLQDYIPPYYSLKRSPFNAAFLFFYLYLEVGTTILRHSVGTRELDVVAYK